MVMMTMVLQPEIVRLSYNADLSSVDANEAGAGCRSHQG